MKIDIHPVAFAYLKARNAFANADETSPDYDRLDTEEIAAWEAWRDHNPPCPVYDLSTMETEEKSAN